MKREIFEFLFKYHRGAVAPVPAGASEQPVDERYVYSANVKLSQDGYTMDKTLIEACLRASKTEFLKFWEQLSAVASVYRARIERTSPVWPNFPEDAMDATSVELYVVNLLHFWTAGEWAPEFDIAKVAPGLIMPSCNLKIVPAATEESAVNLIAELYSRQSPLSADEAADVAKVMACPEIAVRVRDALQGKKIPCRESVALYTKDILAVGDLSNDTVVCQLRSARDVLRVASAMSDGDVSLATATRFRNFSRKERRLLLELTENTAAIAESMVKNREEWKRLGEKLHPGEYAKKYPKVYDAITKIRGNETIETFEGTLQKLMTCRPVNLVDLCRHLEKRPGVYARNLDFALRNSTDLFSAYAVLSNFERIARSVDTRVLMQLLNHFRNRHIGVQMSAGKKSGAATYVKTTPVPEIPDLVIDAAVKILSAAIASQLRQKAGETIYIDSESVSGKKIVFPTNVRQMSAGEKVYASGSALPIPENMDVVRAFLYWKGDDMGGKGYQNSIDLDLSVLFLNENFCPVGTIAYYSPRFLQVNGIHSGDKRYSGKDGAVEYVDFSLKKAQKNNIDYAMMTVNSYSGQMFSELESVFCGWMSRDGETGDQFEPRTVQNRFDLTINSRQQASILIDIKNRRYIVIDKVLHQEVRYGTVEDAKREISDITKWAVQDRSLTLEEVLEMTGRMVERAEDADVVVSDSNKFADLENNPRTIVPWDATGIVRLVFPDSEA